MRFITENDFRLKYKESPFTVYEIKSDEKITPGAKQFLVDRGIKIIENSFIKPSATNKISDNKDTKKIIEKIKASFLCIQSKLLLLAQEVYAYDSENIIHIIDIQEGLENIFSNNFNNGDKDINNDIFIRVNKTHLSLPNSKTIFTINAIRADLLEIKLFIEDCISDNTLSSSLLERVHFIINRLSQIIYNIVGGKNE